MPTCPPPTASTLGTFVAGSQPVGVPRLDATCGVGVSGETTCGLWYGYVCQPALSLGAVLPAIIQTIDVVVAVPAAGLGEAASLPAVYESDTLVTPPAALALAAAPPALIISTAVSPSPAGLGLSVDVPVFAGQEWIAPLDCIGSPQQAICDNPTLCGTVVCGGYSFNEELACLLSFGVPLLNTFLVGTRIVGGPAFNTPVETPPLVLDLQPVECR